jgi:hypothetical protein
MIKINRSIISALKPCKDRFDNYVKFYGDREFTPRQFMGLKNITHADKLWVAFRVLPKEACIKAAVDVAESVLHIYEAKYPNDKRPREAVEAARLYADGKIAREELRTKRDTAYAADTADAYAAYATAAYAAYAAYATDAAAAADAAAAYAADAAAAYAATKKTKQKEIRTIILKYWKQI